MLSSIQKYTYKQIPTHIYGVSFNSENKYQFLKDMWDFVNLFVMSHTHIPRNMRKYFEKSKNNSLSL